MVGDNEVDKHDMVAERADDVVDEVDGGDKLPLTSCKRGYNVSLYVRIIVRPNVPQQMQEAWRLERILA